jgi:hypothetical protein
LAVKLEQPPDSSRPTLSEALEAWEKILAERGFATGAVWIFQENLCIEHSRAEHGGFLFGFQTKFTPPPDDALAAPFFGPARLMSW